MTLYGVFTCMFSCRCLYVYVAYIRILKTDATHEESMEKFDRVTTLEIPSLSSYRDYLRSRYGALVSKSPKWWPRFPVAKVFKLAMIKEKIQRGRIDDEFVRMSITGKLDDILHDKTPVDLENIFSETEDGHKVISIEGAPGSGKSTLSLHICQEWGKGQLFQQYDAVILVRLRDPLVQKAKAIADLLPCADIPIAKQAEEAITQSLGKGVLWVLDGWDELPSEPARDCIIHQLIHKHMDPQGALHASDVIITSRSVSFPRVRSTVSVTNLHSLVSARVEVLGFTPDELKHYFTECLNGDSKAVQSLLDRIRENPVVESSCYLPLNAAHLAQAYIANDYTLASSNHAIFYSIVRFSLSRYMQDQIGMSADEAVVDSLESLPRAVQSLFDQLCRLAYIGVVKNKVTFIPDDLKSARVTTRVTELGLLQAVSSILDIREVYYCFLNLSILEFLAAVHISHMSSSEQISVFQKLFTLPGFSTLFQFYAGITKLRASRRFLSKLPQFLHHDVASIYDVIRTLAVQVLHVGPFIPKIWLVSLFHCLFEASDASLCQFVAVQLKREPDLCYTTMSPLDCFAVGYFLSVVSTTTRGMLTIELRHCSISDLGCKFLATGLSKCLDSNSTVSSQLYIDLANNDISEQGIYPLAEVLDKTKLVHYLDLSHNPIGDNSLKSLCEALITNTSLTSLIVSDCSITISEDNGPVLGELLRKTTTLNIFDLSKNQELTSSGCQYIASGLKDNKSLREFSLSDCGLGVIDSVLREVNESRSLNGLPDINMKGE